MTENTDHGPDDLDVYRGKSRLSAIKEYAKEQQNADESDPDP